MRLFAVFLFLWCGRVPLAFAAIDAPESASLSLVTLESFRAEGIPDEKWPALMETLGTEEQHAAVRGLVLERKPFPAAKLVAMLTHSRLAVRLGALELLEDVAGESFGFDPWQQDPSSGANVEALARWKAWSEKGSTAAPAPALKLTDETFRVIAQEITSGQRDRAERAMQRLEGFGLAAVGHVEAFLQHQPDLEAAPRALLKCAEYRVVIRQALPKQAAALARELALGALEAQSTALAELGKGGVGVLPVIADFLNAADPLVRESAVDAAIAAGGKHSVGLLAARLKEEKTESVLHALLRGVGSLAASQEELTSIARFLDHSSENISVAALEALGEASVGDFQTAFLARLADPRWRVRAAALEAIGKRKVSALKAAVIERLKDEDLFVRVTAVQTLVRIDEKGSKEALTAEFEHQHELKAPILAALFADSDQPPPLKIWTVMAGAPPETILQCLDTLVSRDDYKGKRAPFASLFVQHANRDVSASALRILASHGRYTAHLLAALQSNDPVKIDAVLDALKLPARFFATSAPTPAAGSNPKIDQLYAAFAQTGPAEAQPGAAGLALEEVADSAVFRVVLVKFLREGSPQQRLRAAVVLTQGGEPAAFQYLATAYETLAPLDRRSIAGALDGVAIWSDGTVNDLAVRVLRDPTDDVRETAVETWLNRVSKNSNRVGALLEELSRTGSLLHPSDIYGWEFDRGLSQTSLHTPIQTWCQRILGDPASRDAHKVFALLLLERIRQVQSASLEPFLAAPSAVLRRAAYHALGLAGIEPKLDRLLADDSALVRATLPFLAAPANNAWQHYFDEASHVSDVQDFGGSERSDRSFGAWAGGSGDKGAKVTEPILAALEKLTRDPSEMVRFEAVFAQLRLGRPVEPTTLAGLVASQTEGVNARVRVGNYLEKNYRRLGRGYGVLMPLVEDVEERELDKMLAHFGVSQKDSFLSFAALAAFAPAQTRVADNAVAPPPSTELLRVTPSAPFQVLFFHKPGCRDCARVREMLARHAPDFPRMKLVEHDIEERASTLLNETLSGRFQVKDVLHQATPAVFTQGGVLFREEITFPALGDLLRAAAALPVEEKWAAVDQQAIAVADQTMVTRYATMSGVFVALAGLADGINPCAFATIIFLLSYLHVARRTPREILAVGAAFISAVFLAYFVAGLGLAQILAKLSGLQTVRMWVNYLLAGMTLLVALLSFRDAQLAARGQLGEMTLQLPGLLKEQIRSAIRTSAKARRFVIAAFLAGLVISLLELACTGQVYLPTILYMVRSGRSDAYGYLLIYNVAFIIPLIIVFILAWRGMRSDALIRFQHRNTAMVKVVIGFLFLALTVFLLFGDAFLPRFTVPQ